MLRRLTVIGELLGVTFDCDIVFGVWRVFEMRFVVFRVVLIRTRGDYDFLVEFRFGEFVLDDFYLRAAVRMCLDFCLILGDVQT